MPVKYLTASDIPTIVDDVLKALDQREAVRKDKAEAEAAFIKQAEAAERVDIWRDKQRSLAEEQANCQHAHKSTHDFCDGIRRWVRCQDCDKNWRTVQPAPTPKTTAVWARPLLKKCDHTYDGKSAITEARSGVARCSRCMQQWGKDTI